MLNDVTNIKYDRGENILVKQYGNPNILTIPYKKVFFCKPRREWRTCNEFFVEPDSRLTYFGKEVVNRVVIPDSRIYSIFDRYVSAGLYQYDLEPEYQFLLYEGVHFSDQYRVMYLDIETNDSLDSDNAPEPILLIGFDYLGEYKYWDLADYHSERRMLDDFFSCFCSIFPDVVFGWNVKDFDRKYLINRARVLGVKFDWTRFSLCEFIDGMDIMDKKYGWALAKDAGGMSLNAIGNYFVGRGKADTFGLTPGKLYKQRHNDALVYHKEDIYLTKDIDKETQSVSFLQNIQRVSGVLLRDTFFNSKIIDHMILKKYNNYVFPSCVPYTGDVKKYEGGYVFLPKKGVFDNVVIIDFAAMYPSIFMTMNISPESKTNANYDYTIDGVGFKFKPDGIFKETVKFLYEERLKLKGKLKNIKDENSTEYKNLDSLQSAFKTILNSVYGVCAYRGFRFYDVDLAKSITSFGRKMLKEVKRAVEREGLGTVLYGDTDSLFVQYVGGDPEKICKIINSILIPEYLRTYGASENFIKMEVGKNFERLALFGKKKVYVGKLKGSNKFYIKGFSTEKADTPSKIINIFNNMIRELFETNTINLQPYIDELRLLSFKDLAMTKRFNQDKESYKSDPQHLKALRWSMNNLNLDEATHRAKFVSMIFVKMDPDIYDKKSSVDAIVIDDLIQELPKGVDIDYDKYVEFFLIKKMEDLYEVFGFDYSSYVPEKKTRAFNKRMHQVLFRNAVFSYLNGQHRSPLELKNELDIILGSLMDNITYMVETRGVRTLTTGETHREKLECILSEIVSSDLIKRNFSSQCLKDYPAMIEWIKSEVDSFYSI